MNIYLDILKWSIVPMFSVITTGILSAVLLYGSRLITTEGNDIFLEGVNYDFLPKDYIYTFTTSGLLSMFTILIIPLLNNQTPDFHWSGILLIALLTAQTVIDSKYHELADEWNVLITIMTMIYVNQSSNISAQSIIVACLAFLFFALSTIFFSSPGFGDAKLVFSAGLLIGSYMNLYNFLLISIGLAAIINVFSFVVSVIRKDKTWCDFKDVRFPFGPYLVLGFLLLIAGAI